METQFDTTQGIRTSNLVSFDTWLENMDKTRTTGWRWRKDGVIVTHNLFGKLYLTRDEIARFETRALSGEFSRNIQPQQKATTI